MSSLNLQEYQRFVESVTSPEANDLEVFINRLRELEESTDINLTLLLNAASGLAAEGGEFNEIPKKVFWQGKPLDEDTIFHMKRELGDVCWYWMNACRALNMDPQAVIDENVNKLSNRYPGGEFDVMFSENRKAGDL